ncbi:hypothetical protein [Neisseria sp. Ec49-e6-T10]|uniref:hypothetical protein n=1 Tax=Neisseria sp. Ec49-e6-T10 TaxID=3140744 RepID=UPI003EBAFCB7
MAHPELLKYQHTFASVAEDLSYWHKNRKKYAVWAIDISNDVLEERILKAKKHLSPYLVQDYFRKTHFTVAPSGFMCKEKQYEDDYSEELFWADVEQLKSREKKSLHLNIEGFLTSFAIAAFFPVRDEERVFLSLNQMLLRPEISTAVFTPHVTVGLYSEAWPTQEIFARLNTFEVYPLLEEEITEIKLLSYDPNNISGPLLEEASFNLITHELSIYSNLFE